jgi:hypothetical protein
MKVSSCHAFGIFAPPCLRCLILDLLLNVFIQATGNFLAGAGRPGEHSFSSLRAELTFRYHLREAGKRLVRTAERGEDMLMDR